MAVSLYYSAKQNCPQKTKAEQEPLIDSTSLENGASSSSSADGSTVDEVLAHIGMGRFQGFMLFVLGVAYMGDAGEALLLSFLGPDVKCEWNVSSIEESCVTVAVFLGMATGALSFGYLGDRMGRRKTVIADVAMTALFGLLSAASTNIWFLIGCRFVVGAGLGGFPLLLSMYSEFLPTHQRGTTLSLYQLFWGAGAVVTAGMAWVLMPDYHWRGLTVAAASPLGTSPHMHRWRYLHAVLLLLLLPFISESPRYLVVNGREDEAMIILCSMAKTNGKTLPSDIQLKRLEESESTKTNWTDLSQQFQALFVLPLNRITGILWPNWIAIAVGYYSIVMLTTSVQANNANEQSCVDGHVVFSNSDFRDIMIDACAEIPGIIFANITVEYFGRKRMLLFMWLSSALSMMLLPITSSLYTVFLFAGRFLMMGAFTVLMVLVPELYPSSCRSFAMGAGCLVSRAGGALSPFIAQAAYNTYGLPFVAVLQGVLFLLVGALSFLIPFETSGKAMMDTVNEVEEEFKGEGKTGA